MLTKYLFCSDFHSPFYNKRLLTPFIRFIKDFAPDYFELVGDVVDFYSVSKFDQDPNRGLTLQKEIEETNYLLDCLTIAARGANPNVIIEWDEGNHECFDEETEILTKEGWKKHFEIDASTNLATYNKKSNIIEWQKPIEKQTFNHDGEMYHIVNRHTDLLITPNHRLYFSNGSKKRWETKKINDIFIGQNRIYFKSSGTCNNKEYQIKDDEIRIAAWFLTDGGYQKHTGIYLFQRKSKVHLIEEILDRLQWKTSHYERTRNTQFICGKKILSREPEIRISILGEDRKKIWALVPDKKRIPSWVYELSDRQFDIFLNSFIDGDGSRHKSAPSTSLMVYGLKQMLEDLQIACFLHNYRTSISTYRGDDYRLNITKNTTTCLDRAIEYITKEHYSGIVWDVTTPNDTVIVKRKDKISITGNCRLEKYVISTASKVRGITVGGEEVLSIPHIFELKKRKIKWYPELSTHKVNNSFLIEHGKMVKKRAGMTAIGQLDLRNSSGVSGHTHRLGYTARSTMNSKDFWIELGCMCDLNPSYVKSPDWQQGFAIGIYDSEKHQMFPTLIPIYNNHFTYNGNWY